MIRDIVRRASNVESKLLVAFKCVLPVGEGDWDDARLNEMVQTWSYELACVIQAPVGAVESSWKHYWSPSRSNAPSPAEDSPDSPYEKNSPGDDGIVGQVEAGMVLRLKSEVACRSSHEIDAYREQLCMGWIDRFPSKRKPYPNFPDI